jgi:cytochrome c-type biogenesis protein CcmH
MSATPLFFMLSGLLAVATLAMLLRPARLRSLAALRGSLPPLRTSIALLCAVPLAAGLLYAVLGNRAALERAGGDAPPSQAAGHPAGAADVERMVKSLALKLEKNPDDPKGWAMLARSWKVMGRFGEAEQAFARAGKFVDGDPDVLTEYADVVAMRNGGRLEGKATDLVKKALALDPRHATALWMSGTAAYQRKDYAAAKRDWERLLAQLPADSPDRTVISANLDEVGLLSGKAAKPGANGTNGTNGTNGANANAPVAATGQVKQAASPGAAVAASAIRGTVRLSPQVAGAVSPDDAVFVFARPLDGSRMPLAVLRARVADLPLDFVLDASNAMNPERTLDKAGVVVVEARVSRHGDAKSRPGDLLGQRDRVKVGTTGLAVLIDQTL